MCEVAINKVNEIQPGGKTGCLYGVSSVMPSEELLVAGRMSRGVR